MRNRGQNSISRSIRPAPNVALDHGSSVQPKGKRGRPKTSVTREQVVELFRAGKSWRQIARELGIGTATAMRKYQGSEGVPKFNGSSRKSAPHQDTAESNHAHQGGSGVNRGRGVIDVNRGSLIVGAEERLSHAAAPLQAPPIKTAVVDDGIMPIGGKPPSPCTTCGQSWWRNRGDGSPICNFCHPLPIPR